MRLSMPLPIPSWNLKPVVFSMLVDFFFVKVQSLCSNFGGAHVLRQISSQYHKKSEKSYFFLLILTDHTLVLHMLLPIWDTRPPSRQMPRRPRERLRRYWRYFIGSLNFNQMWVTSQIAKSVVKLFSIICTSDIPHERRSLCSR